MIITTEFVGLGVSRNRNGIQTELLLMNISNHCLKTLTKVVRRTLNFIIHWIYIRELARITLMISN